MFKKIIAMVCATTIIFTQIAFAQDEVMAISDAKTEFYEKYGVQKSADVFFNGEYIYFEDAQPLVLSGTTFVPIRKFCDTLGAEVDFIYETYEVVIKNGDEKVSFVAGSADINVNGNIITLPEETFIIESRTMVPARLISEAFGLDVSWNSTYKQVSIVDTNTLKADLDTNYTKLNEILNFSAENDTLENLKSVGQMQVKTGQKGSETEFSIDFEAVSDADMKVIDFDGNLSLDINQVRINMQNQVSKGEMESSTAEILLSYIEMFEDMDMKFIFDVENLEIYMSSSKLGDFGSFFIGNSNITNETVLKLSYADILSDSEILDLNQAINGSILGNDAKNIIETLVDYTLEENINCDLFYTNVYKQAKTILDTFCDDNFDELNKGEFLVNTVKFTYDISVQKQEDELISYSATIDMVDAITGNKMKIMLAQEQSNSCVFEITQENTLDGVTEVLSILGSLQNDTTTESPSSVPSKNVINILD